MDTKFNYFCVDCTCGASTQGKSFYITKDESKEKRKEKCPNDSKQQLKLIGRSVTVLKTMDKEQRVASLKKRSKRHYKRVVEEQKIEMVKRSTPR